MVTIIKDTDFTEVAEGVKPDSKKRVVIPKPLMVEGITYHIYQNRFGQIILDPQVAIPASEAWLFNNPEALALVEQGLADIKKGKVSKIDLNAL